MPLIAGLAFPQDGHFVLARRVEMPVDAIIGSVDLAAGEPFDEWIIGFERPSSTSQTRRARCRRARPETFGIGGGFFVKGAIAFHALNVGAADEFATGRIDGRGGHAENLSKWRGPPRLFTRRRRGERR